MRVIMVPVSDRPESGTALASSFDLAQRLDANIRAFHIRPHRYSQIALPPEAGFLISSDSLEREARQQDKKAESDSLAAHALVERLAEQHNFSLVKRLSGSSRQAIQWSQQVGDVRSLLPLYGPFADLLVLSRPKTRNSRTARTFLVNGLIRTSSPVLVLPPQGRTGLGKRVVVAWDRSHEAASALRAALPILRSADSVSLIVSGEAKPDGPKVSLAREYLAAWGVNCKVHQVRGAKADPVTDITNRMRDDRADLLVMGCYSRHRMRERVFGGVSEHMLYKAKFPILTIHR